MKDLKFTTAGEYMSPPKEYEENIDYELVPVDSTVIFVTETLLFFAWSK